MLWIMVSLVVVGGVLEIVGILLAVAELRARRTALDRYEARPAAVFGSGGGRTSIVGRAGGTGGPQSLEQRIASLEATVEGLRASLREVEERAAVHAEKTAARIAGTVQARVEDQIDRVRDLLLDFTKGGGRALVGLLLLLLGVLMQTAAGALSSFAP